MKEYMNVLKKYAVFSGRASRREYWMFALFNLIVSFVIGFVSGASIGVAMRGNENANLIANIPGNIYSLIVFIPSIAVSIRRAHDTNKSGWWTLVPIYSLILMLTPGDKGQNSYGVDPYGDQNTAVTPQQPTQTPPTTPSDFTPVSPQQ